MLSIEWYVLFIAQCSFSKNLVQINLLHYQWASSKKKMGRGLMTRPSDSVQRRPRPVPGFWIYCISTSLERPDSAVAFPSISWNGCGQRLIFRRPALTGLPYELETQRSWLWQAWRQKREWIGQTASIFISPSIPSWATPLRSKWFSTGSGCQQCVRKKSILTCRPLGGVRPCPGAAPLGHGPPFSWFLDTPLVLRIFFDDI